MKRTLTLLVLALACFSARAQDVLLGFDPNENYVTRYTLPQEFTPNASGLGMYGKIPVDYSSGIPNISIPLTELRAKGYSLPVYLSYYAGGHRTETHPGWVGLGWTLHAGGCINRVIRGFKDDKRGGPICSYDI